MSPVNINQLTYVSGGASLSSGLLTWLGENASAIGVLISGATFFAFLIFSYLNYLISKRNIIHKETIKRNVIKALIDKAEHHEKEVILRVAHK